MGYAGKIIKNASFKKMKGAIKNVKKKTTKSSASIFFDMMSCARKYGAGYYDYQIFAFYDLNRAQRRTYLTRFKNKNFIMYMNDQEVAEKFENKDEFNDLFKDFIGRDFIRIDTADKETVREFVKGKKYLFCKPRSAECGKGIEKVDTEAFDSFDALYEYLTTHNFYNIEECVIQHPQMDVLYPKAVNCMRIITLIGDDGKPHLVYIVQKMGYNGRFLDNNGLFSPVDPKTGKMKYPAHSGDTLKGIIYEEHPDTHVKIAGFQLPFVPEAVEMCLKAAMVEPRVRYVGWDVAITEKGPVIIEGNPYCAHDFWQLPPHTPNKIGIIPTLRKYVPSFFEEYHY